MNISKILFYVFTIGSLIFGGNAIGQEELKSCRLLMQTLPSVDLEDPNLMNKNATDIWSRPLAVYDSFTNETTSVIVFDKHWEDQPFSLVSRSFVTFIGNRGIGTRVFFEDKRSGRVLQKEANKKEIMKKLYSLGKCILPCKISFSKTL